MEMNALQAIAQHLHQERVQFVVAGGMAVVAHGYGRMTFDIDLVIKLDPDNVMRAFAALAKTGYQPRVPITAEQFSDAKQREDWVKNKGMVVLNMWSEKFSDTPVDIFVTEPFDFSILHGDALEEKLPDGTPIRFASIPALIEMKRKAGREKDLDDIRHLEMLRDEA